MFNSNNNSNNNSNLPALNSLSHQWQRSSQNHPNFNKIRQYMQEDSEKIFEQYQPQEGDQQGANIAHFTGANTISQKQSRITANADTDSNGSSFHSDSLHSLHIEGKTIDESTKAGHHQQYDSSLSDEEDSDHDSDTPAASLTLQNLESMADFSQDDKQVIMKELASKFETTCAAITKIDRMSTQQLRDISPEIGYKSNKRCNQIRQLSEDKSLSEQQREELRELLHEEEAYRSSMNSLFARRNISS